MKHSNEMLVLQQTNYKLDMFQGTKADKKHYTKYGNIVKFK